MLVLAATPIGNLGDASRRLMEVLASASVIAAEDTRVAQRLLAGLHVETHARLVIVNEHTERARIAELLDAARVGEVVLSRTQGCRPSPTPGSPSCEPPSTQACR